MQDQLGWRMLWVWGALHSKRFKKERSANQRWVIHFLINEKKERWTEDYVERATTVERKRVQDPEKLTVQVQKDMTTAENTRATTRTPKLRPKRCWIFVETVCGILQVPTMRRFAKMRKMIKRIQSLESWVMMMNLNRWWAQSPKQHGTAWRVHGRSRWGLKNCLNWEGGTRPTPSVREIWSMG